MLRTQRTEGKVIDTTVELDLETIPVDQGLRTIEQALIEEARRRQRRRKRWIAIVVLVLLLASSLAYAAGRIGKVPVVRRGGALPSAKKAPLVYSIGSPIRALKMTRLDMLTAEVGVGVAPITTFSGGLVRAYLTRTNDGGATWKVTGVFPKGFYPWSPAFMTPDSGYVIDSGGALYTSNAGRTWSTVKTTNYSPLSISIRSSMVWIEVEGCPAQGPQIGYCSHLVAYDVGSLLPASVNPVPTDQAILDQVGPTSGYAITTDSQTHKVFFTDDSGRTWRSIASPCDGGQVSGATAASRSTLYVFCGQGSHGNTHQSNLFVTTNGGVSWTGLTAPGDGLITSAGSSGEWLWDFGDGGGLWLSSDGGRTWTESSSVKMGPGGGIVTYGTNMAWHAVPGQGIYHTVNGGDWGVFK
jgi:photosystem II stability/assembly factor-like uncharacterized protein